MSDHSKIEWTDATWNPVRGCSRVSEGCRHCYAERVAARFSGAGQPYEGLAVLTPSGPRWTGKVHLVESALDWPLRWRGSKQARAEGRPSRIFVNSMSDLFHESLPFESIDRVFAVMWLTPWHTFQVLTKRPARMQHYLSSLTFERCRKWMNLAADGGEHRPGAYNLTSIASRTRKARFMAGDKRALNRTNINLPLLNVWLGVSVEDQETADERIPLLLQTPAAVRWISAEPLLGPIDLLATPYGDTLHGHCGEVCDTCGDGFATLDWVVAGGESGPGARPMHPDWARSLRDQCVAAGVPFFFKQWGEWIPYSHATGSVCGVAKHEFSDQRMYRVGKKEAGRQLDGKEWSQFPEVRRG